MASPERRTRKTKLREHENTHTDTRRPGGLYCASPPAAGITAKPPVLHPLACLLTDSRARRASTGLGVHFPELRHRGNREQARTLTFLEAFLVAPLQAFLLFQRFQIPSGQNVGEALLLLLGAIDHGEKLLGTGSIQQEKSSRGPSTGSAGSRGPRPHSEDV